MQRNPKCAINFQDLALTGRKTFFKLQHVQTMKKIVFF